MLATIIIRALQLIIAVIVLGLSIHAAQWQWQGAVPAATAFNAFVGAFTVLVALVGIAAMKVSAISSLIMTGLDGLASVLLLAGGIAYAVKITSLDCGTTPYDYHNAVSNELLNGGCVKRKGIPFCGYDDLDELSGRCKIVEADAAFLFLGFAACLGAAVVCFLAHKRGSAL